MDAATTITISPAIDRNAIIETLARLLQDAVRGKIEWLVFASGEGDNWETGQIQVSDEALAYAIKLLERDLFKRMDGDEDE